MTGYPLQVFDRTLMHGQRLMTLPAAHQLTAALQAIFCIQQLSASKVAWIEIALLVGSWQILKGRLQMTSWRSPLPEAFDLHFGEPVHVSSES